MVGAILCVLVWRRNRSEGQSQLTRASAREIGRTLVVALPAMQGAHALLAEFPRLMFIIAGEGPQRIDLERRLDALRWQRRAGEPLPPRR